MMQNQEPPEPFKSALMDLCKSLVPTIEDFNFKKVTRSVRLRGRMRVLITKTKLSKTIAFDLVDLPKEEPPWICYVRWRF